jgi:hypothetical protein
MTGVRALLLEDDLVVALMDVPTPADRDRAIHFLAGAIPAEILDNVRMLMLNRQTPWHLASHYGLGLRVRNSLREAGFGWSDQYLDENWWGLVEEAVRIGERGG